MNMCDGQEELPSVDDLTVVAEIAEAELRQLEKVQAAQDACRVRAAHGSRSAIAKTAVDSKSVKVCLKCTGDAVAVQLTVVSQVRCSSSKTRTTSRSCSWAVLQLVRTHSCM
jgi:hypothetical protein